MTQRTVPHSYTVAPQLGFWARLVRPLLNLELILTLVRKELKVRYKDSALGFLWSMLNPVLYLVVFYIVFNVLLTGGYPYFQVFLLSGLLPWTLFATSLSTGAGSVVGNGALIKKVAFPREILPYSAVGGSLFHFALQMIVLIGFLVVFRYDFWSEYLVLVPAAIIVEIILISALAMFLSAVTVYLRDVQHFIELALLAWFWMTPIIYPVALVYEKLAPRGLWWVYLMNPITPIVMAFQRGFYNRIDPARPDGTVVNMLLDRPVSWHLEQLAVLGVASFLLLLFSQWVFSRAEGNFAEEL